MNFLEMTSGDIRELDRSQITILFPIAAIEQHGPHLPTGTDTIICDALASAVESRLQDRVLRLPTQWLGASSHHLRFGGTLDSPLPTYIDMLCQTVDPLLKNGFRRVLILNGHGGNIDPMRVALRRLQADWTDALLAAAAYWSIAAQAISDILEGPDRFVGHACEAETSLIMHLRPELVRQDALAGAEGWLPDDIEGMFVCRDMHQRTAAGCTGRPDLSTATKGERLFEAITDRVIAAIERLQDEPLPA